MENVARIGLKRPITVAPRAGTDPQEYDLVCGQGRLEAFIELKQDRIPAIVIDADESDCLVMSLVENCARRQHNPIDLMREIGALRERGYNDRQIGEKIGVSTEYVNMIAGLLEKGEERLVSAVETGVLPLNLAIQISKTDAKGAQKALMDAYLAVQLVVAAGGARHDARADDVVHQHRHGLGRMRVVPHHVAHLVAQQRPGDADLGVGRGSGRAPALGATPARGPVVTARQRLEGLSRHNAPGGGPRGDRSDSPVEPGRRHQRSPRLKPASPATWSGRVVPAMARSMVRIRASRSSAERNPPTCHHS